MKEKELIGKEVYGFKFPDGKDGIHWITNGDMDKLIGQIGVIKKYSQNGKSVWVKFPNSTRNAKSYYWWYPVSMISEHLVKNQETEIFKIL